MPTLYLPHQLRRDMRPDNSYIDTGLHQTDDGVYCFVQFTDMAHANLHKACIVFLHIICWDISKLPQFSTACWLARPSDRCPMPASGIRGIAVVYLGMDAQVISQMRHQFCHSLAFLDFLQCLGIHLPTETISFQITPA